VIINNFARNIVVLSETNKRIVLAEGVSEHRISLVPLIYDFDLSSPSAEAVRAIRESHICDLLAVMISRHVRVKRHVLAFQAIEEVIARGRRVKLLVLDDGPERETLEQYVRERSLGEHVSFLGYRTDVGNFVAASDVLLHPSELEVSTNIVKEAGARGKIVMACRGVGDFDEYLKDMENAVLLNVSDGPSVIADRLVDIAANREKYNDLGARLARRVVEKYGRSATTMAPYLRLLDGSPVPARVSA
jgi:glycosyltransferase involved in cell wall biosynthesis